SSDRVNAQFVLVASEYFDTLKLPLLRGREFTRADDEPANGPRAVVIDRVLARRLFKDADPIGRTIQMALREGDTTTSAFLVVGVAPPHRNDLFDGLDREQIYASLGSQFRGSLTLHVRVAPGAGDSAMVATIQRELRRLDPTPPILSARTMLTHRDSSISE